MGGTKGGKKVEGLMEVGSEDEENRMEEREGGWEGM